MQATIFAVIGRILIGIIEQPGVQDVATAVARRIFKQAATRVVHAINQGTKLRRGMETFH
jgi:hypothetical protein